MSPRGVVGPVGRVLVSRVLLENSQWPYCHHFGCYLGAYGCKLRDRTVPVVIDSSSARFPGMEFFG